MKELSWPAASSLPSAPCKARSRRSRFQPPEVTAATRQPPVLNWEGGDRAAPAPSLTLQTRASWSCRSLMVVFLELSTSCKGRRGIRQRLSGPGGHHPARSEPALPRNSRPQAEVRDRDLPDQHHKRQHSPAIIVCLAARRGRRQHLLRQHRPAVAAPGELQGKRLPEKTLEAAEQRNSSTPAAVGELDAVTPSQECVFLPAAVAPASR